MQRNRKDVKIVLVQWNPDIILDRIFLEELPDGSVLVVHPQDEGSYLSCGSYRTFIETKEWRLIKRPEYVPFDSVYEFKGLWIKNEPYGYEEPITCIDVKGNRVKLGARFYTPEELFKATEYSLDGHSVGKLKSEGN